MYSLANRFSNDIGDRRTWSQAMSASNGPVVQKRLDGETRVSERKEEEAEEEEEIEAQDGDGGGGGGERGIVNADRPIVNFIR